MTVFFILLLLALIAGGYYVYQRLLTIEREIRADQRALAEEQDTPLETHTEDAGDEPVAAAVVSVEETASAGNSLEDRILALVEESPGMSQPQLYAAFADGDRRELQKLLREMDQQGRLRREKKGNSYRLHPL